MKQHLRSFLTLLMLVVWASGFAADFTADFTNGNIPSGWSKTGTTVKNDNYGTQLITGTSVTSPAFTEAIKTITINLTRSGKGTTFTIGYIKDGKTTTIKTFQKTDVTENSLKNYNVDVPTEAQVSGVKFVFTCTKASYYIKTITFTSGVSKTATTLTFPLSTINIEEGNEATFTGQTATLKAGGTVLNKTIAYTKSGDDIFATFNTATGDATLKTGVFGTATVTATYAGDKTYEKAEASYTVTVKNPNVLESTTTYDFVNNTYDYPRNRNLKNGAIISNESPVTIVNTKNGATTQSKFTNNDFRNYKAAVLTINAKEGCLINKITITGTRINQLNLNGKDGTWDNGVWTGSASSVSFTNPGGSNNAVCFETITIEYTAPAPITLEEDADNTVSKIEANNGKTIDVKLTRSLKAGVWNTICLPFDVTAEQIKNILKAEGMVREYADDDATAQTITFKKVEGNMKAGEPYLIKPTEDITSLAFEGVTITAVEGNLQGKAYGIWGTLGKYAMKTDGTELFLNAAGKFVAPAAATNTMKGFRAYFMVPKGSSAAALNINFDGETTGINDIETEATVNGKVYNLNGQYVGNSLNGLKKGIYVVNGKKVIK